MLYPFEKILRILRRRQAASRLKNRVFRLLGFNSCYLIILVIIENIWYLSSTFRWILLSPLLANGILLLWIRDYWVDRNIHKKPEENTRLMKTLGYQFPEVRDKLINAWQLSKQSDPLSQMAVQRLSVTLPAEHLLQHLEQNTSPSSGFSLRIKTFLSLLIFLSFSFFLKDALIRVFTPNRTYPVPFPWTWRIEPGNVTLQEGDSLEIRITHTLPRHFPKKLVIQNLEKTETLLPETINDTLSTLFIPDLKTSFTYTLIVRRPHPFMPWTQKSSQTYAVNVMKRPVLEWLEFQVIPPAYTGLKQEIYTGGTDRIHLLEGSLLNITGRLSRPPGNVTACLGEHYTQLDIRNQHFQGTLKPVLSGKLIITAKDTNGTSMENDVRYHISLFEDEKPILKVLTPEEDLLLNENMDIPWGVFISDDFGIASFSLETRAVKSFQVEPDTVWTDYPLSFDRDQKIQTTSGVWHIQERLSPGDALEFRFKVTDNNILSGPGISRSRVFTARFPSLTELFSRTSRQHADTHENLQSLQDLSENLQEKAELLRQEILKKGEVDWSEQETMKNLIEQQDMVKESLKSIKEALEKQLAEMSEQSLFSDEVLDNMAYMQELVKDLEKSEIFRELQKMQERLKSNPDAETMERMSRDLQKEAETFSKALERTIRLLETLRDMETLEEGERILEEALRKQTDLIKDEKSRTSAELAKTEHDLSEMIQNLQQNLSQSSGNVSERLQEKLENFSALLDSSALSRILQEAAQAFAENQRPEGMNKAGESRQKMDELLKQYQAMASNMNQARKEEILQDFQQLLRRALLISEKQEQTLPGTKTLKNDSQALQDRFSEQNAILESLNHLEAGLENIAGKTFFMGPQPFQELQAARSLSAEALNHLLEGRFQQAEQTMEQNLGQINDLTGTILGLMGQAQDSESGSGIEQFMEQLQALADMQGALNQDSRGMPMPGPGNASMDLMSQLAARQQALRRELGRVKQAMEQTGQGDGRNLDSITQEMEDVIRDLREGRYSRRTMQRQQSIQQRLLDASRSIRKRELSRERESRTGEQIVRRGPDELPYNLGNIESLIQNIRQQMNHTQLSPEEREEMERYLEKLRDILE
jgi:hypothetical protein